MARRYWETLARIGAGVDAVARVGHPDVTARIGGRALRIQSKYRQRPSPSAQRIGRHPSSCERRGRLLAVLRTRPADRMDVRTHAQAQALVGRTVPLRC